MCVPKNMYIRTGAEPLMNRLNRFSYCKLFDSTKIFVKFRIVFGYADSATTLTA